VVFLRNKFVRGFLLLSFGCAAVLGQSTTGTILGSVTDPSGAVVPGVVVTVTDLGTGITTSSSSDGHGDYVVTPLAIGTYSIAFEAKGFKKYVESGIKVDVQDRVRVNATLQIGRAAEMIEVQAAAPLLETDTSSLGQVVDSQRIVDLPLNGRFFTRLAVLTSGTVPTPSGARDENTGGFSANGVRPYQNNFILDGVDNNSLSEDLVSQASFVVGPPPDAIAEFKVETNSMSAEYGRSGGAVLNVNIKAGTNQLHGTAYEFLRNSAMDAKNYFDPGSSPIPAFKENQFGFSLGGPIVLPKIYNGRNRTFFFLDYQGTRIRSSETFLASVPPSAWRNGDFSGYQQIFDPKTTVTNADGTVTRQPFANNQIPASEFDPVAQRLINLFPAPNVAGSVASSGVGNNYLSNPTSPDDTDQYDIRIDHKISDSDSIFGRLSFSDRNLTPPGAIPPPLDSASFSSGNFLNNARSAVISETHIFTPHIVNEIRLGYNRNRSERLQFNSDKDLSALYGIPGIPFTANNGGLPSFNITDLTSFGSSEYQPTVEVQNVYQIVDSLSWVKGRHSIKFGAELKPRVDFSILQPPVPRGSFSFNGNSTRDPNNLSNTGLGTADFLLGAVSGGSQIASFINDEFQQPGYAGYVQDDFKVSKKLTLNMGLRYEFVSNVMEKYNALANFNVATGELDIVKGRTDPLPPNFYPEIPVNRNASRTLVPNRKLDFAPRFGFAYNIAPHTVIRGGYGLFYSSYESGPLSIPNPGNNPPFFEQTNYLPISTTQLNPVGSQLSQGFPLDALSNPSAPSLFSLAPNFKNPNVQQWNFGLEQDLGWNSVFSLSYAGSKGTRLYEFRNANQPTPSANPNSDLNSRRPYPFVPTDFPTWCSCGSSTYHSLQAKVEKRFSQGLSFLGAYTFSKAIDEQSNASLGFVSGGGFRDPRYPSEEKALADFNVADRFVLSLSYELPFGKGKMFAGSADGITNALIGGWELQTVSSFQTGTPRTVTANIPVSNSDGSEEDRPDVVGNISVVPVGQGPNNWINPLAFQTAVAGTYGNSGRNVVTAAGVTSVDLSAFKDFAIRERAKLQFRAEAFNLPNHPNFRSDSLNASWGSSSFGEYSAARPSRQLQMALKLIF
jgi:Carboxypeptidase regulatory-like domain/TonB dependent receptor